jgi:hypothetical protein
MANFFCVKEATTQRDMINEVIRAASEPGKNVRNGCLYQFHLRIDFHEDHSVCATNHYVCMKSYAR